MGREIRRVPKGWEHPQNEYCPHLNGMVWSHMHFEKPGDYTYGKCFKPMNDEDVESAFKEWFDGWEQWRQGIHEWQVKYPEDSPPTYASYVEYAGASPDPEYYRPAWKPEEMTCYQIYETVSEGTPISPVFETENEMIDWLIHQGYSEKAARTFSEWGSVPSGVFSPKTGFVSGIDVAGMD